MNEVRFINVPLSSKSEHQYYFGSKEAQTNFFKSKQVGATRTCRPWRDDEDSILVDIDKKEFKKLKCNYVMFANNDDVYTYAYIMKHSEPSVGTTRLEIEIDPIQTSIYDVDILTSWVERKHVPRFANGLPIVNTLSEGLDYGSEYVMVSKKQYYPYGNTGFCLVSAKMDYQNYETTQAADVQPGAIGNVPNGLHWYLIPFDLDGGSTKYQINGATVLQLPQFYNEITTNEKFVGTVVSMSIVDYVPFVESVNGRQVKIDPNYLVRTRGMKDTLLPLNGGVCMIREGSFNTKSYSFGNKYEGIPNYAESKLMMYPYSFSMLIDEKGNAINIKNEYIDGNNVEVLINGCISGNAKTSYMINNYLSDNTMKKALISMSNSSLNIIDEYSAAYNQGSSNTNTMAKVMGVTGAIGGTLAAVASGGLSLPVAGVIGGSIGTVSRMIAKERDIAASPDNLSLQGNNANFDYGNGLKGIYLVKYTITQEYSNMLTSYFKKYGYKINRLEKPNIHSRLHFDYIKTVDVNIVGSAPNSHIEKIKEFMDKGGTFWHGDYLGNYALANGEV